jgi:hypothetical protein
MEKKPNRTLITLVILGIGMILLGSGLYFADKSSDKSSTLDSGQDLTLLPYPDVPRTTIQEAMDAYDQDKAIFVDVRGDDYYDEIHIPGSLSIPVIFLDERITQLDPDDWIITYCT